MVRDGASRLLTMRILVLSAPRRLEGCERNTFKTQLRFPRRKAPELCMTLPPIEGVGMPGARCTRSRAWCVVNTRVSHHGYTGSPGIPARTGVNGFLRALPGDRALLSPSSGAVSCAELERQRRGVRTTRLRRPHARALVRSAARVHRIPSRVRDDRDTPLMWDGMCVFCF